MACMAPGETWLMTANGASPFQRRLRKMSANQRLDSCSYLISGSPSGFLHSHHLTATSFTFEPHSQCSTHLICIGGMDPCLNPDCTRVFMLTRVLQLYIVCSCTTLVHLADAFLMRVANTPTRVRTLSKKFFRLLESVEIGLHGRHAGNSLNL